MKKLLPKISSLLLALLLMCAWIGGCGDPQDSVLDSPVKLDTPVVAVGAKGVAVWNRVDGALYYLYVVDGGAETPTTENSAQLSEGQTIKVKAVSGKEGYEDSDYSEPQTFRGGVVAGHDHSDVNADGICDLCGESVMAELSFYAVNDLHGKFMDSDTQPGVDEFTTYLKDLYADDAREEILLSSGDMWQGTVESSTNKGQLMTEWMNEAGFVSMTLGNHEFDWGADVLKPNSELAEFPFLAINVTQNGAPVDYCSPSTVVERGGVTIGIIGAIGDCLGSISGEFSEGLSFATGDRLTSLVKDEAVRLREEEGCDFIVYSIHDGGSKFSSSGTTPVKNADMAYYDSALSDGYVDLVFEGHTHTRYILQDEYGVYHLQGGSENRYVSSAEVSFNTVTGEYTVSPNMIGTGVYAKDSIEDDPSVEALFEKYFPDENPYTDVIGTNARRRSGDDICAQLALLYYRKGVEVWGNDYRPIVLGGGYLNTRNPYALTAGEVTYADLFSLLPFDNEIVLGKIKGSDLKSRFLRSDSYFVYATIDASEVNDSSDYYIIVDSYTSSYKRNRITEIARLDKGIYARDLLADFIASGEWAR